MCVCDMQVKEVEERCSHKEAEFDTFRKQLRNEPESHLRAQTSVLQMEKVRTPTTAAVVL